ncbi:hypothetical protein BSLG_008837 [Batrachochytrium salamandrivorans]|nr:hypothetical protein BASA83_004702 [Batrachochytrium salamandrivorans]KAJ1332535.1 hypothetical protein BSLG_008837 [Batrachochytrium salamandrivorans]
MKLAFFAIVSLLSFTSSVTAAVDVAAMTKKFNAMSGDPVFPSTYTGSKTKIVRQRTRTTTESFTLPTKMPEPPKSEHYFPDDATDEELTEAQSVFPEESETYTLFERCKQELQRLKKVGEKLKAELIELGSKLGGAENKLKCELEKIEKRIKLKQDAGQRTSVLEGVKKRVEAQLEDLNKDRSADEERYRRDSSRLENVWVRIEKVKQGLDDIMLSSSQMADSEEENNA